MTGALPSLTVAAQDEPPTSARRYYLTVLFSDLVGSTPLAGAMAVEDYDLLAYGPLRAAWEELIPAYGGRVTETRGDGAVAVFGWPEAHEGDGLTATLAALALHERMRALDGIRPGAPPLRLHSGVHSGLVLVREVDGRLELLGSTMNVAARLADAAGPDQIIVSEATLGPDRGALETGDRLFLTLKGKENPIAAVAVLGQTADKTRYGARERSALSPFVGRRLELQRLQDLAGRAAAGGTAFVAVVGSPGVGKTRLITELLARNGGLRTFRGECDAEGAEPLQPFLQILRSALALDGAPDSARSPQAVEDGLAAFDEELGAHRAVLLRLMTRGEAGKQRTPPSATAVAAAFRALFKALATDEPVALFVDDWHSADDASRKLLQALREQAWPGLLVLLTMRGEAGAERFEDFERLDVTPFSDEEAGAAIRQVLPNADPFLIDDIRQAAGGNALFIEELCHSVAYGEQDFRTHGGSGWLDILIESRFARLDDEQAELLATAAVIGNVIPTWLLEHVTGHAADDPLLAKLAEGDFVFPGERQGTLRFKHGITREVIYDSVGLRERRALHLKIAGALQQKAETEGEEEYLEALAYHYGAGGDAPLAANYSELAGDKALAASALDRAQDHYRAALNALDRMPRTAEIERRWQRIARRFGFAGIWDPSDEQLPVLRQAVERAAARGDRYGEARAEYWLGYNHFGQGRSRQAIAHCERALAVATPLGDRALETQIRATLGQSRMLACDYVRALALLDPAIDAMKREPIEPGTPLGLAYSLSSKGMALADQGHFAEARACFLEAVERVEDADHPIEASVRSQYGVACVWQGCMEEAIRIAVDAERVSTRVMSFFLFARNRSKHAYARWALTGDQSGIDQLVETTVWLENNRRDQYMSLNYGWLTEMMAAVGDYHQARDYARRTIMRARHKDRTGEAMAYRALARLAAAGRMRRSPNHYLRGARASAAARGSAHEAAANQLCEAEIALDAGDSARALSLLDQADAAFARMDMRRHAEQAARLRSAAG